MLMHTHAQPPRGAAQETERGKKPGLADAVTGAGRAGERNIARRLTAVAVDMDTWAVRGPARPAAGAPD